MASAAPNDQYGPASSPLRFSSSGGSEPALVASQRGAIYAQGRTRRRPPVQPTPERYREIQEALLKHGYGSPPATGKWTKKWVEALRQFQKDHGLEPHGRIDSLSLIALGLGPERVYRNGIFRGRETKNPQADANHKEAEKDTPRSEDAGSSTPQSQAEKET